MSAAARRALARAFGTAVALILLFVFALPAIARDSGSSKELIVRTHAPALPPSDASAAERARGQVLTGLIPAVACPHLWSVRNTSLCTHGPDPAPAGINVGRIRSTQELVAGTIEGASSASSTTSSVPCYGDGSAGDRVQVVYAHAADVPDRFSSLSASLVQWAANVDRSFSDSAAMTGGVRHVRWVTDSSCDLVIQRVQLSTTGDDSYSSTANELQSVGLNRTDRKYLVWVDATVYCGISSLTTDDSASLSNANNKGPGYARIDTGCWGQTNSVEAHELMHLLGGVQLSAPHSSGAGHCYDADDRMCYSDGGPYFQSGGKITYPCLDSSLSRLFDCNHDDYFSTSPAPGSYLASHWNTASSYFLDPGTPNGWSPTTSPSATPTASPSPTTSASPSPSPSGGSSPSTSTATFSGTLNRKVASRSFPLTVGSGTVTASLSFTKAKSANLSFVLGGSTLASRSGASPEGLSVSVSGGTYSLLVSQGGSASFTLTVTYPTP
jgi:hypothetical protein